MAAPLQNLFFEGMLQDIGFQSFRSVDSDSWACSFSQRSDVRAASLKENFRDLLILRNEAWSSLVAGFQGWEIQGLRIALKDVKGF